MTTRHETATHTPGPWKLENQINADPSASTVQVFDGEYNFIAEAKYASPNNCAAPKWEQANANARLIAASPDLLEALQDSMRLTTASMAPDWWQAKARAAIAKAQGNV